MGKVGTLPITIGNTIVWIHVYSLEGYSYY